MQDEVNAKMSGLAKQSAKSALRLLWKQWEKMTRNIQTKQQKVTHGKTTMKKLAAQNRGMKSFELPDNCSIGQFDRIMRRYGVDYALKKDATGATVKSMVFFKGQDVDAFSQAFKEFSKVATEMDSKPSVMETIEKLQAEIKQQPVKEKVKDLVR